MTELYGVYQRSVGDPQDFQGRILPLVLDDAKIGDWRARLAISEHWRKEAEEMEPMLPRLGYMGHRQYQAARDWSIHLADILDHINDRLSPHGFDAIVRNDYAALMELLESRQAASSPRSR